MRQCRQTLRSVRGLLNKRTPPPLTPVLLFIIARQPPRAGSGLRGLILRLGGSVGRELIQVLVPGHVGLLDDDGRLNENKLGVLACFADGSELRGGQHASPYEGAGLACFE